MAHVHKQHYTCKVPAKAKLVTEKGRGEVWRWKGRDGGWMYGVPVKGKPGRCTCETKAWHVTYFDHAAGKEKTVKGYADRAATDALMVKLVSTAARVDAGLLPPEAARPRLTLAELLDRWREYTRHRSTEGGARRRFQRADAIVTGTGATRASDLTPSTVLRWVAAKVKSDNYAAETGVAYLSAIKGFTRWLVMVEKSETVDHLSGLKASMDGDVHRQRRALPPGELEKLLDATAASGGTVSGLSPAERHALYLTASATGLRAVELSRLTAADLDRNAEELTLRKPAKAKGKRVDVLPLERAVIDCVLTACPRTGPLWPGRCSPTTQWWLRAAGMLRHDLDAAGIPFRDAEGRVYDFHSLRGQYATDLDRHGVSLARAQKLMRHSSPGMTSKYYTRPEKGELAKESAKLNRGRLVKKKGKKVG